MTDDGATRLSQLALLGKLAREAEERRLVGVDAGVVWHAAALATARRPAVEALFPAVYAGSLCQQMLSMYGSPARVVRHVIQSTSTRPSARSICSEPVCTRPF